LFLQVKFWLKLDLAFTDNCGKSVKSVGVSSSISGKIGEFNVKLFNKDLVERYGKLCCNQSIKFVPAGKDEKESKNGWKIPETKFSKEALKKIYSAFELVYEDDAEDDSFTEVIPNDLNDVITKVSEIREIMADKGLENNGLPTRMTGRARVHQVLTPKTKRYYQNLSPSDRSIFDKGYDAKIKRRRYLVMTEEDEVAQSQSQSFIDNANASAVQVIADFQSTAPTLDGVVNRDGVTTPTIVIAEEAIQNKSPTIVIAEETTENKSPTIVTAIDATEKGQ